MTAILVLVVVTRGAMFLEAVCVVLFIEATTNIITKSELTAPFRSFLFSRSKFLHDLFDCGYCLSVWVSVIVSFYLTYFRSEVVDIFGMGLVFHRLSNVAHFFIDWLDNIRRGQGNF